MDIRDYIRINTLYLLQGTPKVELEKVIGHSTAQRITSFKWHGYISVGTLQKLADFFNVEVQDMIDSYKIERKIKELIQNKVINEGDIYDN